MNSLSSQVAIVGLGATEFSKDSGRTEIRLATEAVLAALSDAGIDPAEVDGLCTYSVDNNPEREVFRQIGGKELKFFARTPEGGGAACAPFLHGMMAIATGVANVVVVYRAMNERSWYRFGAGMQGKEADPFFETTNFGYYIPHGLVSPASWVAMSAQRYMHEFGATSEDLGRIAVAARDFAATNPKAFFYGKPITLEDHQNSRWIAEPLRLLDCCQESDGAVAMVLVSREYAKKLKQTPVFLKAAAQGTYEDQQMMTSYYRSSITGLPEAGLVARQLWQMSGLSPKDVQTAVIYDHFTPFVLPQLEEYGFAGRGEAKYFIREGRHARGGDLPINTHGGQLGEAYIHGMNGVAEAVRQVRGDAVNQVKGVKNALVTAGTGVPTSGLIVGQD